MSMYGTVEFDFYMDGLSADNCTQSAQTGAGHVLGAPKQAKRTRAASTDTDRALRQSRSQQRSVPALWSRKERRGWRSTASQTSSPRVVAQQVGGLRAGSSVPTGQRKRGPVIPEPPLGDETGRGAGRRLVQGRAVGPSQMPSELSVRSSAYSDLAG